MQDMTIILQILWTSLATSTYDVLFAVAFALVLKVTRLFNFAQAAVMTIAFYTAFLVVQVLEWPAWVAFIAMLATTLTASATGITSAVVNLTIGPPPAISSLNFGSPLTVANTCRKA